MKSKRRLTTRQMVEQAIRSETYADIMLDWTFKRVFAQEQNKDILISLLNALLPTEKQVSDLEYLPTELQGLSETKRVLRLDLRCEAADGSQFIVEVQHYRQDSFFKRCVAYAGAVYWDELQKGGDYEELAPVYVIALMAENASVSEDMSGMVGISAAPSNVDESAEIPTKSTEKVVSWYQMTEKDTGEVLRDTIFAIFVQLDRFHKEESECESFLDKWFFVPKNMKRLHAQPIEFQEAVFEKLFSSLDIKKFTKMEKDNYFKIRMRIAELDEIDIRKTAERIAREKGLKEGREKGRKEKGLEVAKNLKSLGIAEELICQSTGLSATQVRSL